MPTSGRLASRRVIVCLAGIAIFGVVFASVRAPSAPTSSGSSDARLFRDVVEGLRSGGDYYDLTGAGLRAGHYSTALTFNWRTPFLYEPLARVPAPGRRWLFLALGCLLLLASTRPPQPVLAPLLILHALIVAVVASEPVYFAELWGGVCLGLSVIAFARHREATGVAWAILALFVRELAAPFCVAAACYAAWRRRRSEVLMWVAGLALYGLFYGWHALQVRQHIRPDDLAQAGSWLYGGGLTFLVEIVRSMGLLFLAPVWVVAALISLSVAAWWAPDLPIHLRMSVVLYVLFFSIAGQPFNGYWGLMFSPLFALWLAFVPSGLAALWQDPPRDFKQPEA